MDTTESSLEIKCENLMSIVVESRKRFGKMCVDYDKKIKFMENKLLNLKIEPISNYRFKPKNPAKSTEDDLEEMEAFAAELLQMNKKRDELMNRIKNTQEVVAQLKSDAIGRRLQEPLTADALVAKAMAKKITFD